MYLRHRRLSLVTLVAATFALRAMPRGACHEALAAENDLLRGFWHVAAPLNQAWLDEQQRSPSLFDLEAAVDLVRPVPGRIRDAATSVCAA